MKKIFTAAVLAIITMSASVNAQNVVWRYIYLPSNTISSTSYESLQTCERVISQQLSSKDFRCFMDKK